MVVSRQDLAIAGGRERQGEGFRAEELAENIKLRGRTGKMTKKLSLAFKKRIDHRTKTNRVIK